MCILLSFLSHNFCMADTPIIGNFLQTNLYLEWKQNRIDWESQMECSKRDLEDIHKKALARYFELRKSCPLLSHEKADACKNDMKRLDIVMAEANRGLEELATLKRKKQQFWW